jgi:hypothetical protein
MNSKVEKAVESIKSRIDDATHGLSRADYRDALEEIDAEVDARLEALKEEQGADEDGVESTTK